MKNWQDQSPLLIKRLNHSPYYQEGFLKNEVEALSSFGRVLETDDPTFAHILITNTHTKVDELIRPQIDFAKLIIHPNSGYDNYSDHFVAQCEAPIILGNPIRAKAVAHYILSALFDSVSAVPHHVLWDKERKWSRTLLHEKKIVLIGYGHIGKMLHQSLKPLVADLVIYDPYNGHHQLNIKEADVVILACSLNKKSKYMIDKKFLNQIKTDALIINAARGELIKTEDLTTFLKANPEASAVCDVFEKEPCEFYPFRDIKNLKTTSHIAGVYKTIDRETIAFEVQTIRDFLELNEFDFKNKYQSLILANRLKPELGLI
jgi:D-3-phosphoglycerate dehydrogenase